MTARSAGPTDEFGFPIIPAPVDSSERKRRTIIDAALAEFLREGYAAASVDAITARSGVSKATIYKHFGNKERLFLAAVGSFLPSSYAELEPGISGLADAPDLRAALITLAVDWARLLMHPQVLSLRRLVIGEIDRFPQLGRLWYRVTYDLNNGPLVDTFAELHRRGALRVPDLPLAVQQLVAATVGVPLLIRTFNPDAEFDDAELTRQMTSGVDLFLAGYAAR
ncbi:TetR/AcrR family transcriptional regulator [Kitasatospora viridis]|uniref:TetR family transcriptional regulator n=1 Tax=Kitasatospora viridis TaxID=281105 RepID=A0A561UK06_9ACTN|nr:TetR/AcrR family transcriptional regulator [Kitasatospora viridis]TWF99694.1 TetR family transcriptional regulator [Kitasatospora viridis]